MRQVLGAIAQFEKASAVAKLAAARKRKREAAGKCEGRKSHSEVRPDAVALARRLRRRKPKGGQTHDRAPGVSRAERLAAPSVAPTIPGAGRRVPRGGTSGSL